MNVNKAQVRHTPNSHSLFPAASHWGIRIYSQSFQARASSNRLVLPRREIFPQDISAILGHWQ